LSNAAFFIAAWFLWRHYRQDMKNTCCLGASCWQKGFVAQGPTDSYTGNSVAVGDINGDGNADLIIGAIYNNKVYVVFGSRLGFPDPLPLANLDGTNGFEIDNWMGFPYEFLGGTVTTGDINGDGITDIILGVPRQSFFNAWFSGSVYVVYGKRGTWTSPQTLNAGYGTLIDGTQGFRLDGTAVGQYLPDSVAAGDINGDGIADLIIGNISPNSSAGYTYVVFGKNTSSSTFLPNTTVNWADQRECYFRGQSDNGHSLSPSLFRDQSKLQLPDHERDEYFWQLEYDLYFEFQARARELHQSSLNSWDILFAMQHYGVPTRLLDWTEVFAVALFFAIEGYDPLAQRTPCIWVLNPYTLNKRDKRPNFDGDLLSPKILGYDDKEDEYWGYDDLLIHDGWMDWKSPLAVYPELKNDRIQAQRGSFTIHGDLYKPLDEQFPPGRFKILRRVDIPPKAIPGAQLFLRQAGINRHQLFPDLDGLAISLKQKYGVARVLPPPHDMRTMARQAGS
jgi:hypothetical protein